MNNNIVKVWYLSNNEAGKKLSLQVKNLGIQTSYFDIAEVSNIAPLQEHINVFIFDLDLQTDLVVDIVIKDKRFKNSLKLCLLSKKQIQEFTEKSYNAFKLELLPRPINDETFLLLLEKSILVELYRDLLNGDNSNAFEGIMEIKRKNIFAADKSGFDAILKFENNPQKGLKKKIKNMNLDSFLKTN